MDSEAITILGWFEMRRIMDRVYDAIYISDPRNPNSETDAIRIVDLWFGPCVLFDGHIWTWNCRPSDRGIRIRWVGRPDDVYVSGAPQWSDYREADEVESARIMGWLDRL